MAVFESLRPFKFRLGPFCVGCSVVLSSHLASWKNLCCGKLAATFLPQRFIAKSWSGVAKAEKWLQYIYLLLGHNTSLRKIRYLGYC